MLCSGLRLLVHSLSGVRQSIQKCCHRTAPGLQADRSIESLFAELVSSGILQACPPRTLDAYVGCSNFLAATLERAGVTPDPSPANVRQALTEYCLLPLGSAYVHEK